MIRELSVYRCICSKCKGTWITKDHALPVRCAKCNVKTWNDDFDFGQAQIEAPPMRIETPEVAPIAAPIDGKQARLEAARAALMSVETRVFSPVEETEPEWKFTKEPTWYDDTNTPYRRQWIQTGTKPTYRNVEVDEFDHNEVVRVK